MRFESIAAQVKVTFPYAAGWFGFVGELPFEHKLQALVVAFEHPQIVARPDCAPRQVALIEVS